MPISIYKQPDTKTHSSLDSHRFNKSISLIFVHVSFFLLFFFSVFFFYVMFWQFFLVCASTIAAIRSQQLSISMDHVPCMICHVHHYVIHCLDNRKLKIINILLLTKRFFWSFFVLFHFVPIACVSRRYCIYKQIRSDSSLTRLCLFSYSFKYLNQLSYYRHVNDVQPSHNFTVIWLIEFWTYRVVHLTDNKTIYSIWIIYLFTKSSKYDEVFKSCYFPFEIKR